MRIRFRQSGRFYLSDVTVDVAPPPEIKGFRRNSSAVVRNSRYAFVLERPGGPGAGEWRLKAFHPADSPDPAPRELTDDRFADGPGYTWPYRTPYGDLLTDFFDAPSFRLLGCGPSPADPALVRVQFVTVPPPPTAGQKPQPRLSGWCDLDPAAGWSIRRTAVTSGPEDDATVTTVTLASTLEGEGLVRMDEQTAENKWTKGGAVRSHTAAVSKYKVWIDRDVPEREFSLTAYGLPEPPGVRFAPRTPTYVWLLVAAGGFAALAVVFRWLSRRRPAATALPTPPPHP